MMGVDRTDYIIYGWKLPYPEDEDAYDKFYDDENILPMIEGHEGEEYRLIMDGMNGEYIVFGKLIAQDSAERYIGWGFVELQMDIQDHPISMEIRYRQIFGSVPPEPTMFVFSHFT